MNNLMTSKTISSREVAEMLEIKHWEVLRKIENIIKILNDNKIVVVDFFEEAVYLDAKGEKRKCYKITKQGCEFLANKYTGRKGITFTAKYVKAFNDMQQQLPKLSKELQAIFQLDHKQQQIESRLDLLENTSTIDFGQQRTLQLQAKKVAIKRLGGIESNAYKDKSLRARVFSTLWKDYKDYVEVAAYRDTLKKDYQSGLIYLRSWTLNGSLQREVDKKNDASAMQM